MFVYMYRYIYIYILVLCDCLRSGFEKHSACESNIEIRSLLVGMGAIFEVSVTGVLLLEHALLL